jgi:hypothetical protein
VILTVTLLVATSLLALFCDYLRYRMYRRLAAARPKEAYVLRTAIVPTLVPEIEVATRAPWVPVQVPRANQATRLAAAMQQRRILDSNIPPVPSGKKSKMRRAS